MNHTLLYVFSPGVAGDVLFRTRRALSACLAASALLVVSTFFSSPAHATIFSYGNFVGTDVTYLGVTEDTATDPGPLFGAPSISGNQLDFDPSGFAATATGAGGVDITDGQLNFGVLAQASAVIDNLMLKEAGDFTLFGTGTAATAVSVSAPTIVDITEVDGVALSPAIQITTNMLFAPVGNPPSPFANYNLVTHPGVGTLWSGLLMVDIKQKLIDEGISFTLGATKIEVVIDNVMTATSESGTTSLIAKKDFSGFTVTTDIPEPTSCCLVVVGLLAFATIRRRS